jgi:uncharacterized protein (TIGR02271 family)
LYFRVKIIKQESFSSVIKEDKKRKPALRFTASSFVAGKREITMNQPKDTGQRPEMGDPSNHRPKGPVTTIPVMEEQVKVGKKVMETGRIRLTKQVHEEEVTVDERITSEEVEVERVPINKFVEAPPPAVRYEGDRMIISVLREVLVVEKRLELVEELHLTKRKVESGEPQKVTLRKEEVSVHRVDGTNQSQGSGLNR